MNEKTMSGCKYDASWKKGVSRRRVDLRSEAFPFPFSFLSILETGTIAGPDPAVQELDLGGGGTLRSEGFVLKALLQSKKAKGQTSFLVLAV